MHSFEHISSLSHQGSHTAAEFSASEAKMSSAKKKGGKEKKAVKKEDPGNADSATNQPSPKELQARLAAAEEEKMKESEERNYTQLERDKIAAFWEIKKKEYEQLKAELLIKDRNIEEMQQRHQDEIKVYNQKMKHLLYEQQNIISTLKSEHELAAVMHREQAAKREAELLNDIRGLKQKLKEMELSYEDTLRQLKLDHSKDTTKMKHELDLSARELHNKTMEKIKAVREEAEARRKQEIHEIEERKNTHINELMKKHEKAFTEIKCYYNDITHNNLDLIKTLKEDVADMKKKEAANEKLMYEIAQENKRLTEPLTKALKEVENLRKQLEKYEKDKHSLQQSRVWHAEAVKQLKKLELEHGILQQRFDEVEAERDELRSKFEISMFEMKQKCDLKNLLLEKKVNVLEDNLEKKELAKLKMDQCTQEELDKFLDTKNNEIKSLRFNLAKITKAYNDAIKAFEIKLAEYGIPLEEMGLLHYISTA